jgi:hypothetical protein
MKFPKGVIIKILRILGIFHIEKWSQEGRIINIREIDTLPYSSIVQNILPFFMFR